jgi:hypothetical protein
LDDVLNKPSAYEGRTLKAHGVRIEIPSKVGNTLAMMGRLFGDSDGIPSYTSIPAVAKSGRKFTLVIDLRRRGQLAEKVSDLCKNAEVFTITYMVKRNDVSGEWELMLIDMEK